VRRGGEGSGLAGLRFLIVGGLLFRVRGANNNQFQYIIPNRPVFFQAEDMRFYYCQEGYKRAIANNEARAVTST
jgi:hypothetical protein